MNRLKLGIIFSAVVLAGCGTIPSYNRPEKALITPPPQFGTVVFSAEGSGSCISVSTALVIAPAGSDYLKNAVAQADVDGWAVASDFDDHLGTLNVVTLRAGDYEAYPYTLNPYIVGTRVPMAQFSVRAGEAVYIGNYYMPVSCSLHNVSRFRDLANRDLALVRQKNPGFANITFEKRLASFQGYVRGGPSDPRLVIAPGPSTPDPAPGGSDMHPVAKDDVAASAPLPACTKEQSRLKQLAEQKRYRLDRYCQ